MKLYLAGPINGCTDDEANNWREAVKAIFGHDNCINPMKRDYRGKEKECVNEIVDLDMRDIRESDVIVINKSKPSDGTSMEQFYAAFCLNKPIIVWCPPDANLSPWVRRFSTSVVTSFSELIAKVKEFAA